MIFNMIPIDKYFRPEGGGSTHGDDLLAVAAGSNQLIKILVRRVLATVADLELRCSQMSCRLAWPKRCLLPMSNVPDNT